MTKKGLIVTRFGVKGYAPLIIAAGGYCEVYLYELNDLGINDLSKLRGQIVLLCTLRELKQDCWEELSERIEQLAPPAVVWSLPPQYPLWGNIDDLYSNIRDMTLNPEIHFLDAPFPLRASWQNSPAAVYDPFAPQSMKLNQKPKHSLYWRIHGWHTERWIRRYAPAQLDELSSLINRFSPRFVSFAHSQRVNQLNELLKVRNGS